MSYQTEYFEVVKFNSHSFGIQWYQVGSNLQKQMLSNNHPLGINYLLINS
jgi:hypothetical protein